MDKPAAIILAGGKSDRFGSPKPFLKFDTNRTFLDKLVNVYSEFGCSHITVVLNESFANDFNDTVMNGTNSKVRIMQNNRQDLGRFYSIRLGIQSLPQPCFCFIQNIDNPFTGIELLMKLYQAQESSAYTAPEHNGEGGHPIIISPEIVESISRETDNSLNLREYLKQFKKIPVNTDDELVLVNINTKEDYEKYFERSL